MSAREPDSRGSGSQKIGLPELFRLLEAGRPEEVCAVAIVLGALRPNHAEVVPRLGRALREGPETAHSYLMEALARFDSAEVFPILAGELRAGGARREQAVHVLPSLGAAVVPHLEAFREAEPARYRPALARVLARIPAESAIDMLIAMLEEEDFEVAKAVSLSLRHTRRDRDPQLAQYLAQRMAERLSSELHATGRIAILKALEPGPGEVAVPAVLSQLDPEAPLALRLAAFEALGRVVSPRSDAELLRPALLGFLERHDSDARSAEAALKVLRKGLLRGEDRPLLVAIAQEGRADLASFALRALSAIPSPESTAFLLAVVAEEDDRRQGAALAALEASEGVGPTLFERYADSELASRRSELRSILARRRSEIDPEAHRALLRRLREADDLEDPLRRDLLLLASALEPEATTAELEASASDELGAGRSPERAIAWLEPLVRHRLATAEGRYILALLHLRRSEASPNPLADRAFERATQLLAPLARLPEFALGPRLSTETRIGESALAALLLWWRTRSEDPGEVVRHLEGRSEAGPSGWDRGLPKS